MLEDSLTIAIDWRRATHAQRVKTRESVTLTIFIYRSGSAAALGRLAHPQIFWNRGTSHPIPSHPISFRRVAAGRAGPGRAGRCTSSPSKQFDISIIPHRYTGGWVPLSLSCSLSFLGTPLGAPTRSRLSTRVTKNCAVARTPSTRAHFSPIRSPTISPRGRLMRITSFYSGEI